MDRDKIIQFFRYYGIELFKFEGIKLGLIVNPIAGMGGRVGLKGTDGKVEKALKLGAKPIAPRRAVEFLLNLRDVKDLIELYTYPGEMGELEALEAGFKPNVIGNIGKTTTADDTKRAAMELSKIVDLMVFVGGDGTARDVCEVLKDEFPVIGVPSGVKMYSAVFALNPKACAEVVKAFIRGDVTFELREVMDADENSIEEDRISVRLFGYMKVPVISNLVQRVKRADRGNKDGLAINFLRILDEDTAYIMGPGGTIYHIARAMGVEKTLLGVDVIVNGRIVVKDASEKDLISILDRYEKVKIVVTPIGGQGFIFGRGNLQISPEVLKRVKRENVIVVSTLDKLRELDSLKIDTGDSEVDRMFEGEMDVLTEIGFVKFRVEYV